MVADWQIWNKEKQEIFNEYDRHLTDFANHIYNKNIRRQKNNVIHNGITVDNNLWLPVDKTLNQDNIDKYLNLKHDQTDHRGTGLDISKLEEGLWIKKGADASYGLQTVCILELG